MKRTLMILLVALALLIMTPRAALACDGFLSCLFGDFGITEMAERDAQKQEQMADIKRAQAQEVERIQQDANVKIEEAKTALARAKNEKYADDNQRAIAIRNAELAYQAYEQQVQSWVDTQTKLLEENGKSQRESITQAAQVSIAGINQTGTTERARIHWDGSYNLVTVILVGIIVLYAIRRKAQPPVINVFPVAPGQLDARPSVYLPRHHYQISQDKEC